MYRFIRWLICMNFHTRNLNNWIPATSDYTSFMCRKCGRIERTQ